MMSWWGLQGWRFLDDVIACHDIAWGNYLIPDKQWNDVSAQLSLLHIHVRCIVEPDHDDYCEEKVSWHGVCLAWMSQ